jgi:transposase
VEGKCPSRDELIQLAKEKPEAIADLVIALWARVEALEAKVAELSKNSRNSSKPPSSDKHGPSRPQRTANEGPKRKPGGQPGHKGSTLEMRPDPDHIIEHSFDTHCGNCGRSLHNAVATGFERRQVFDLPPLKLEVTEHRVCCGQCPHCSEPVRGSFPAEVQASVQYGVNVQVLVSYLGAYQMLPCERTSEFFGDLFGCPMSVGTVRNILTKAGQWAQPSVQRIVETLRTVPLLGADETGASLAGKNHWLHIACTSTLSYYFFHAKRGFEALEDMGILRGYTGALLHDFYHSYYQYEACVHYLCNAHHLRDLTYVHETLGQPWAEEMIKLLVEAKDLREQHDEGIRRIGRRTNQRILDDYRAIVQSGYAMNPEPQKIAGKRGRIKRGKALNLLDRFRDRELEVLGFFLHEGIPFDNNQAERDLRMIKAKLKISGCFRSMDAATAFANLRSVISTARKLGRSILDTLKRMFESPHDLASELVVDPAPT